MTTPFAEQSPLPLRIQPATLTDVLTITRLHRMVLGYTLNAELGDAHMQRLYRGLLRSAHGVVMAAHLEDELIGFVSGTDEGARLQQDLIRTPGTRILLSLLLGLLHRPWLIGKLLTQLMVNRPLIYQNEIVRAELLTLGVHPRWSRRGIGGQLARAFSKELRRRGVKYFHLNTMSTNTHARAFYQNMGGKLWRSYRGNDIYLFVLD